MKCRFPFFPPSKYQIYSLVKDELTGRWTKRCSAKVTLLIAVAETALQEVATGSSALSVLPGAFLRKQPCLVGEAIQPYIRLVPCSAGKTTFLHQGLWHFSLKNHTVFENFRCLRWSMKVYIWGGQTSLLSYSRCSLQSSPFLPSCQAVPYHFSLACIHSSTPFS